MMPSLRSRSAVLAAFFVAVAVAACGASADSATFGASDSNGTVPGSGGGASSDAATSFNPGADAGIGAAPTDQNALCGFIDGMSPCRPDEIPAASNKCSSGIDAGGSAPVDAGSGYDAGASTIACHVTLDTSSSSAAPQCSAAGAGTNGVQCNVSDDCAAGFECVGTPGVCRHYCCSLPSSCASQFFCDIQPEKATPSVKVPVCEPVHSCQLMGGDNMCGAGETCAIVNDNDGTTSCVSIGPAHVGESCETTHCGKDLVCLGDIGVRTCFALCNKSKPSCESGETCSGSAPLFQGVNSGIGICQ